MDLRVAGADADAFARAFEASSAFDGSLTSARAMNAFARETIERALRRASSRERGREDGGGDGDDAASTRSGDEASTATRVETEDVGEDSSQPPPPPTTTTTMGTFASDPVDALLARARVDSESDAESSDEEAGTSTATVKGRVGAPPTAEETHERWTAKKRRVHAARSGRGTIQVSMTFEIISTRAKGEAGVEARLAELENTTAGMTAQTHRISQQEYVTRLRRLNDDIATAWLKEDRVNALKLSVKVAKLLSDTNVGKFYPVLFILVTEVIETMGRLVYDRISRKAEETLETGEARRLPENFKASDVRLLAKNTCKNWFYKVATIRDMIPRMYMELALFKCYRFLHDGPPVAQVQRLLRMTRGIGDPLAAAYMRMYIAKCALECGCETSDNGQTLEILKEFMPSYVSVLDEKADDDPATTYVFRLGLRRAEYSELMDPAMEWLIECCAHNPNPSLLHKVLYMGGETPPVPFLRAVFRSLSPTIFKENAFKLISLVSASATSDEEETLERLENMADCYALIAQKFNDVAPHENERLEILGEVWKVAQKWNRIEPYLRVAEAFLRYVVAYLSRAEMETLMKDVARHVHAALTEEREGESNAEAPTLSSDAMSRVERMLRAVTERYEDVDDVISLKWYMYLGEILRGDAKVKFSAGLLRCAEKKGIITDPVCLEALLEAAKTCNDDIDGMSTDAARADTESLVVRFINSVDFGSDFEAHLNFLVSARSAFANLDLVQEVLVYRAIALVVGVYDRVGGEHTARTKSFVNACTAYCQVTIPSVRGVDVRLRLFTLTARAAIAHGLVQQVDGLIRSAVTDAQESGGESAVGGWMDLPTDRADAEMLEFARACGSLLVVTPGNLEKGAFLVFRGLLKVVEDFDWAPESANQARAYVSMIPLITAMAQPKLPYKIEGVQSNDVLFAGETAYVEEATELAHELLQRAVDLAGAEPTDADGNGDEHEDQDEEEAHKKSHGEDVARVNLELASVIAMTCKPSPEMFALTDGVVERARRRLPPSVVDPIASRALDLLRPTSGNNTDDMET